jgi:hypothetical protein
MVRSGDSGPASSQPQRLASHVPRPVEEQKKGSGVIRGQTPRRRQRSISQVFESLTDDFVERLLRVPCTLEELQRGIGQVQDGLATLERSIAEERLRS